MSAKSSAASAVKSGTRQRALELLQSPDYFPKLLDAVRRCGLIGEQRNACAIHIVGISAQLDRPVNAIVKGPSSSGKNILVSRVLKLTPPEVVREITSSSATAWNYAGDDFRHKIVYLQERNDAAGAVHPVRLLISEGRLVRIVTKNEGGQFVPKRFEAEGPIASISTTTRDRIEVDDETRHVSLWVDQSREQTRRVNQGYLSRVKPLTDAEIYVWRDAYRAVADRAQLRVDIPSWFEMVAASVYDVDIAARRYFPAFVEGCRSIAVLRSFQNQPNSAKSISLTFADFSIAALLFEGVFVESLHRRSDKNSETRRWVKELSREKGAGVTGPELAKALDISYDQAYARLREAADAGVVFQSNRPPKSNQKLFLPTPLPRFIPNPEKILKRITSIKKPVEFVHPLTGKTVKLSG